MFSVYRPFPVFWLERGHLVNRSAPSDSLDREWESRRTGCLVHSRSTFSSTTREREEERERKRDKIFTRLQTRLSRSIHEEEKEGRNETRRTKECEVVGCSIEAIILEDDWFSDCVWKCLNTRENGGLRERGWKLINDRKLFYLGKNKKKWWREIVMKIEIEVTIILSKSFFFSI